jgi:hypothetical protein
MAELMRKEVIESSVRVPKRFVSLHAHTGFS